MALRFPFDGPSVPIDGQAAAPEVPGHVLAVAN